MQMSIGQVLGIPTAGDRRRAAERAGLRRGMKRGLEKGMEKGLEKGLQKGVEKRNTEVALDMLADNKPIEEIVGYSHLSKEKVLELRESQASYVSK